MDFLGKIKKYAEGAVAQASPFDKGKTFSDVVGTPKARPQSAPVPTPKPGEIQRDNSFGSRLKRVGTGVGLGAVRSATGFAQGVSGLYDLATPGTGTNRFSKKLDKFAQFTDETAKTEGVPDIAYKGGQLATDVLAFRGAGTVARAAGKAPTIVKATRPVTRASQPIKRVINRTADRLAEHGAPGRIASTTLRESTRPANIAADLAFTSKFIGEDASKGREITPERVGLDVLLGTAFNVGIPAAGATAREAFNKVRSLPREARNRAAQTASHQVKAQTVPVGRLQRTDLSGYGDLDPARVNHYERRLAQGKPIPPLTVIRGNDGRLYTEDGKHRLAALRRRGFKNARAKIITPEEIGKVTEGGYVALPGKRGADENGAAKGRANIGRSALTEQTPSAVSGRQVSSEPIIPSAGGPLTYAEAKRIVEEDPVSVAQILRDRPGVQQSVEADAPIAPGVQGRDLLNNNPLAGSKEFIDLNKAPSMADLPSLARPRPELQRILSNIDELPESGTQFTVGERTGSGGEKLRVVESVKRDGRGGIERYRYSPDMPIPVAADDVIRDANLLRQTDAPVTNKTVKEINAEQRALLNQWLGTRTAAEIEGIRKATNTRLDELKPEQHEAFVHAMEKDPSQWTSELRPAQEAFRQATDELYDLATKNGVNMNRVRAYITHIWDEKTLPKPDSKEAETLFNPFHYGNERKLYRTYADAAEAGVKMKYKDPRKILAVYTAELHKTMADISYIKRLKDEGVLLEAPAGSRPDLKEIVIPERLQGSVNNPDEFMGLGNTLYTTHDNARVINQTLSPEEPVTRAEKTFHHTAKVASRMQDIGLSGGIWGTPVNAFAIAQAVKEMTAGRFKGPAVAFANSMTNKGANKYFAENDQFIKEMLREGVPFSSSYDIPSMSGFAGQMRDANGFTQHAAATWDALVSDPTFKRFLPIMQVQLYKDIRKKALKKGMSEKEAKKTAGETVRKLYGLRDTYDLAKRNKLADDLLTTFLFAPKYRAAMLRMWANTVKAIGDPRNPSNHTSLKFAAGALLTYGAMNAINYAANGTMLWNNPDGKEDKLLLPGGTYIGLPFLSSIATVPKYIGKTVKHSIEGKGDEVIQDLMGFASYGVRPLADVFLTNESWSGRKIVGEDDTAGEKAVKRAGHVTTSYLPTWLREGLRGLGGGLPEGAREFLQIPEGGQPGYQTATNLLELPIRYYDPKYFRGQPPEFRGAPGSDRNLQGALQLIEKADRDIQERYRKAFSQDDLAITRLSDDERQRLIESGNLSQEKVEGLDRYTLSVKRDLDLSPGEAGQTMPKESKRMYQMFQDFYRDRAYVHDDDLDKWRTQPADGSSKKLIERASGMLQEGWPALPETNEVAELYANFSKNRKEGNWGEAKETKEKRKFLKEAYVTALDRQQKEWLKMSDADIRSAIESGEIGKADLDALVGFDDQLRAIGLSGDLGTSLRDDYGYKTWGKSGSGGRRGRSATPSLGADFFNTSSIISQLNKLLGSARL